MKTKICSKCKEEKNFTEFYVRKNRKSGYTSSCKKCKRKQGRIKYTAHPIESKIVGGDTKKCTMCQSIKPVHDFYERKDRRVGIASECKVCVVSRNIKYRNLKQKTDVHFRLRILLRDRFTKAIKNNSKTGSAVRDLGCSIEKLKLYLEKMFRPGMSWGNHGAGEDKWHIDHVKPLSIFDLTDRKQLLEACHYTNLQPLWQVENLKKGAYYR
ncbi:hypothetical protein DRQ25_14710 [Candidatus Fermentibacteria bacterium]|nr:MAG: hypothetical protein DRQ25_14710 [Candidatus Fermentibacteria bacterium]